MTKKSDTYELQELIELTTDQLGLGQPFVVEKRLLRFSSSTPAFRLRPFP